MKRTPRGNAILASLLFFLFGIMPVSAQVTDTHIQYCLISGVTGQRVISDNISFNTVTFLVENAARIPISGVKVEPSSSLFGSSISPPSALTDDNGFVTFTVKSSQPGTTQLAGSCGAYPVAEPRSLTFYQQASPSLSKVVVSPATAPADGASIITMTVTLIDSLGNPVPGQIPFFAGNHNTFPVNGFSVVPSLSAVQPTDSFGRTTAVFRSTKPGSIEYTITTPEGYIIPTPGAFSFTEYMPPQISDADSRIELTSPQSASQILADGTQEASLLVTLRDSHQQPISGKRVRLVSTTMLHFSPEQVTDAQGHARFTVQSLVSGKPSISAVIDSDSVTLSSKPTVQFVRPLSIDKSSVSVSSSQILGNGIDEATVRVALRDEEGTALIGRRVRIQSASAGVLIAPSAAVTNELGQAVFRVMSDIIGSFTLKAIVDDSTLLGTNNIAALGAAAGEAAPQPPVHPAASSPASTEQSVQTGASASSVASSRYSELRVNTAKPPANSQVVYTLFVRNSSGNPIPSRVVSIFLSYGGELRVYARTTDANGMARVEFIPTKPGELTVSTLIDSVNLITSATVVSDLPSEQALAAQGTATTAISTATLGAGTTTTDIAASGVDMEEQGPDETEDVPDPQPGYMIGVSGSDVLRYRHPLTSLVVDLLSPDQAFISLKRISTLVSTQTLGRIPLHQTNSSRFLATRRQFAGRFIRVKGDPGRLWYVYPETLKRTWFNGTRASYEYLKKFVQK